MVDILPTACDIDVWAVDVVGNQPISPHKP
jgi:hypothetical protein